MSRAPIPTWTFALVVVRHGDRVLLVRERKHGGGWYLPAGRVEPGERLVDGARRETLEESGVDVTLDGILRLEHHPSIDGTRLRVFFRARASGDPTPKSIADEHSLGAAWFTLDELMGLHLRGREVIAWARAVLAEDVPVAPMSILTDEGAPP